MHTRALILFPLLVLSRSASLESRNDLLNAIGDEVTAFGYHMKIGVPKAIYLLKYEGGHSRIVGGSQVASASAIPHQAGIVARLTSGWQSICGGALISNTRVLTAAHCWWDGQNQANLFTIVLGSLTIFTGGTRIDTSDVTVHPNWNLQQLTNDIAMVKITSVTYNNNVQAIPLPTIAEVNLDFAGLTGTVSGFGKTSDCVSQHMRLFYKFDIKYINTMYVGDSHNGIVRFGIVWESPNSIKSQTSTPLTTSLYQVSVNIITNSVCQNSLGGVSLHGSHLCTSGSGGVGSCDGDSGGPLTIVHNNRRTLVGVVSFGLSEGCQFGNPSVYTRVTAFVTWITANM